MRTPDDFEFTPRRLEKSEELEFVAWAENHKWLCRKLKFEGRIGAPDRILFGYGHIVLIEMKKPGGKLSKGQVLEHQRIRDRGCQVHVCYTKDEAVAILRSYM